MVLVNFCQILGTLAQAEDHLVFQSNEADNRDGGAFYAISQGQMRLNWTSRMTFLNNSGK